MKRISIVAGIVLLTNGCSEYTANDIDSPPSKPIVAIQPAYPSAGESLFCAIVTEATDPDGDEVSYEYTWKRNNEVMGDMTNPFVSGEDTEAEDVWLCEATPVANRLKGEKGTSTAYIRLGNQAPYAPAVFVEPAHPTPADDLLCRVEGSESDPDGDDVTYGYQWQRNGVDTGDVTESISFSATKALDEWTCVVTPHDGQVEGATGQATVQVCLPGEGPECAARSCLDVLEQGEEVSDGLYWIDPVGSGPYQAYCDMTTDGGGWTLTMKLDDAASVFEYDAVYWTTEDLYNEGEVLPNVDAFGVNAKFSAYNDVPGDTMRLQYANPIGNIHYRDLNGSTLLELFGSSDEIILAGKESVSVCEPLLSGVPDYDHDLMRFGSARQIFGINAFDSGAGSAYSKMRFGFASNDELVSAWGTQVGIGAASDWHGKHTGRSVVWNTTSDCYNNCSCYGAGDTSYDTSANLWVR